MPSFSDAETLLRAVRSVIAQTYENFELLIVDDCSAVPIAEVITGHFTDRRLRVIRHNANRGAAAARNTGVQNANGAYIAFLDDDDEWMSDKLSRQLAFMQEKSERKLTTTAFLLRRPGFTDEVRRFPAVLGRADFLYGCGVSPGSTILLDRASYDEIGELDPEMRRLEDWDWLLRAMSKFDLHVLDVPLATIHAKPKDIFPDVIAATKTMYAKREDYGLRSSSEQTILRSSLHHEVAASAYNAGKLPVALGQILLSFSLAPLKARAFYRRIFVRLMVDFRRLTGLGR